MVIKQLAVTYEPKINPVLDGSCCQTIRHGTRYQVGDELLIHGWAGRPYWSPWTWRYRVTVTSVQKILVSDEGIKFYSVLGNRFEVWSELDWLAKADYINPATGSELRKILLDKVPKKKFTKQGTIMQIVKWDCNKPKRSLSDGITSF